VGSIFTDKSVYDALNCRITKSNQLSNFFRGMAIFKVFKDKFSLLNRCAWSHFDKFTFLQVELSKFSTNLFHHLRKKVKKA